MELLSALFILFIVVLNQTTFPVFSTEIHEDKYYCTSQEYPTITKTLVLSPNDKYLSSEILTNITGKTVPQTGKHKTHTVIQI